jgi:hypothetical protein
MNFANISHFVVGVISFHDYNETAYCLANATRNNEIKRCTNISGYYPGDYFPLFIFQVSCLQKNNFCGNNMQGLNVSAVRVKSLEFGYELDNGTYTDAMGELQNGDFDTYSAYGGQTVANYEDFACPVVGETNFVVLMRRQDIFAINTNGLMAGLNIGVYCLIFAAICCLAIIAFVNETNEGEKNSLWNILNSLMPSNSPPLKNDTGFTRRVIIITCGITVFLSTTYYQSNLLQMLLIPEKRIKSDINDVSRSIATFKSKMYTFKEMLNFLNNSNMLSLKNAININPPETELFAFDLPGNIINDNGIYLDEIGLITRELSLLPPNECVNYDVIDVSDIMPAWICMVVRNERRDLLEPLSVIIAERLDFINNIMDKPQMSEECMKHIYPPEKAETRFVPLSIYSLSGAFAVLVCLLVASFLVFVVEFMFRKCCSHKGIKSTEVALHEKPALQILKELMDNVQSDKRVHMMNHYRLLQTMLANDEGDLKESSMY